MNKNMVIIIVESVIIFVLTASLLLFDLDFKTFNFVEGFYWLFLGVFFVTLSKTMSHRYKRWTLFTFLILVLFGLSDFIEMNTGAYWIPGWLLVWNMGCILGFIFSLIWYVKLRL